MTAEHDLHAGLRRVAEQLDGASAPTDVAAVIGRRPPASPRPARAVLATAAVLALLMGLVALLASEDQDEGVKADVPPASVTVEGEGEGEDTATTLVPDPSPSDPPPSDSSPSTETTVPQPIVPPSYEGAPWEDLPVRGLAVVDGGRVLIVDLAGSELGSFAEADLPGVGNDPADPILIGAGTTMQLGEPGAREADGCVSTGRAGVRVAICGPEQEELVRLAPSGEETPLAGRPFGAIVGRWRVAEPSPDGRWVLGTFSVECEVPFAVLVPAGGGEPRTADGFTDLGGDTPPFAVSSYSVGWTDDGQAVVVFSGDDACGTADLAPGTYLVDPDTGLRTMLRPGNPDRVLRWERVEDVNDLERAIQRARLELGLEFGGGDHGGTGAFSSVVWEGRTVGVSAYPPEMAAPTEDPGATGGERVEIDGVAATAFEVDGVPLLAFACIDAVWVLGGSEDGIAAEVLRDVASALIPRLYCTVGEPPTIGAG
ncbi:MAG TPA: hypothetical protein VK507_16680 [Iamia sp.]|nr:hypothetical protein [Iamia sp.]